ncbi:hypothetical protein V6N13_063760 [Hibiscus sabdariffa]|uniref:Uncharacterized protein n=1 Tax=Hibiscus sabdariffa TaxID=183260 RepID=A0ABR2R149_9ROSI
MLSLVQNDNRPTCIDDIHGDNVESAYDDSEAIAHVSNNNDDARDISGDVAPANSGGCSLPPSVSTSLNNDDCLIVPTNTH